MQPRRRLAAAAWLGNPLVVYLGGTGYVEPLLALSVTAACWAFWRWRRDGRDGWLALAAVFAGAAAATKYLGLYFVGMLALGALLGGSPAPAASRAGRLRSLALFGGVALLVMAPWYGRIVAMTGNPVFPYLPEVFGSGEVAVIADRIIAALTTLTGDPGAVLAQRPVLTAAGTETDTVGQVRAKREWTIWVLLGLFAFACGEMAWAWFCGRAV